MAENVKSYLGVKMVKKKFSGQTIAIIILAILLLLTIGFGGVFAFYSARSNQVSGKIVMANLKISLESGTGESDKSEIVISNGVNVVPGQPLENSPLVIRNLSSVDIYLVVVYEINATKDDKTVIEDEHIDPVLGLGVEYINPIANVSSTAGVSNPAWVDYVYNATEEGKVYRCLVSMVAFAPTAANDNGIVVIGEDRLSLAGAMGNEFQNTSISFTFQAYAIGSATFSGQFTTSTTKQTKCETIVDAIYEAQDHKFLNVSVNN